MANWEKLNKGFEDVLNGVTDGEWDEFKTEIDKMRGQKQLLNSPVIIPRILYFIDENGNNIDVNAAGVNAKLLRDGTFEYFISYGFAGRKELTPMYEV